VVYCPLKLCSNQLPCYSGVRASELEVNKSSLQVIEALLQLSRHCVNIIVWSLCEILDKLSKACLLNYTCWVCADFVTQKFINTSPENVSEVLDSEFYVVQVLIEVLTFHWNMSTEERAIGHEEPWKSTTTLPQKFSDENLRSNRLTLLDDPPALEDNVAKYALVAMLTFIRRCGPTKADNVRVNDRVDALEMLHEADKFDMDTAVLHAGRQLPLRTDLSLIPPSKGTSQGSGSSGRYQATQSLSSLASGGGTTSSLALYIPSAMAVRTSAHSATATMAVTHLYANCFLITKFVARGFLPVLVQEESFIDSRRQIGQLFSLVYGIRSIFLRLICRRKGRT
jgi:hypothetical protein